MGTPRTDSAVKDIDRHLNGRFDPTFSNSEPLEIRAEGYQHRDPDDKTSPLSDRTDRTTGEPPNTLRSDPSSDKDKTIGQLRKQEDRVVIPSKPGVETPRSDVRMDGRGDNTIRLDLETEDGKKQEIFLDDKALSNGVGHVDRRASEAKYATMKEHASRRKQELEQILNEHAEIVTQLAQQSSQKSSLGSR